MSNIAHSLQIKYGLSNPPSEEKIKLWVQKTEEYISSGFDKEKAGEKSAQDIFPDYQKIKYAAQADTIVALLIQAKNK